MSVHVCTHIKGCLFQREIQFEESNLIRTHWILRGLHVFKWVSWGPGWLWLPQECFSNGTGRMMAGAEW